MFFLDLVCFSIINFLFVYFFTFSLSIERKKLLRQAQADAKREIEEYKSMRDAKLRTVQPEVSNTGI